MVKIKIELKYFCIILSVIGIVVLYFLSLFSQPTIIKLSEISSYEGKQVIVQGITKEYYTTTYGSQIITIEEENASTKVFLEGMIPIEYGDIIQATGTVQKYKGSWEIVVDNIHYVKIVKKWNNISMPLWQIAENPNRYSGLNVNISGYVDTIYDDYFYLSDLEGEHSIIVNYVYQNDFFLTPGLKINVAARFSYDVGDFRYKLEISENTHGIFPAGAE